jgi:hypothetical protein
MTLPEHYARSALSPPSDLPIDHYIEQEVSLGRDSDLKGQVSFDLFPQVRYFLRCCADPEVQSVVLMCSAQSACMNRTWDNFEKPFAANSLRQAAEIARLECEAAGWCK